MTRARASRFVDQSYAIITSFTRAERISDAFRSRKGTLALNRDVIYACYDNTPVMIGDAVRRGETAELATRLRKRMDVVARV